MSSFNRITFAGTTKLDTALILPNSAVFNTNKDKIATSYFMPIGKLTGKKIGDRVVALGAYLPKTGKIKKAELVIYAQELLNYCQVNGINNIIVANGDYFKYLSGCKVVEKHIGEVFKCPLDGFEEISVTPTINMAMIDRFPEKQAQLDKANKCAAALIEGVETLDVPFAFESYEEVHDPVRLAELFKEYGAYPNLACDIETTGLYVGPTEVLTIAFAYDEYNAFTVPVHDHYGEHCKELQELTKQFLIDYKGTQIFHNGLYDVKQLVYAWFMKDFNDVKGMIEGLDAIQFDDTFILSFLELNSTVRPSLGLKVLAYDFLGDYAEDVKLAINIPLADLAVYNAKDVCGTFYVYNKMKHQLTSEPYVAIMKPSFRPMLKMMLNGMPLDLDRVTEVSSALKADLLEAEGKLKDNAYIKLVTRQLRQTASEKYNASHVTMTKSPGDFMDLNFNPNSSLQLRLLLFDIMGFEPVDFTKTKAPKTDRASILEFLEFADSEQKPVLEALVTISQAGIVLNTFINAFQELSVTQGDSTTLHGSLVLGGTQSGRLSSRDPNLQNLPSNSKWGKAIKSCFPAPDGWLFVGSDFNALNFGGLVK